MYTRDTHSQADHLPTASPPSSKASYEIRVQNHLDAGWGCWFEGWTLTNLSDGETLISCPGIDQAALHGVLNLIRDLNLTLISVCRKEPSSPGYFDPIDFVGERK